MRPTTHTALTVLALLGAALAVPTAAAAPSSLALDAPESVPANTTVPVNVTLRLSQFLCHEPHTVTVTLSATSSDGVLGAFQRTTLQFAIPAESFYVDAYERTQTANLTVRAIAAGTVDVAASFSADVGPCFVPGGFEPATAAATIAVEAPPAPVTATTNETAGTNETNGTNATNATAKPTPATPKRTSNNTAPSCGPDGGCGKIGEYEAPAESSNDTPGVGFLLMLGVLGIAALVARRGK